METLQDPLTRFVRHDRAIAAIVKAGRGDAAAFAELVAAGDELRQVVVRPFTWEPVAADG
jgi:hypothetical protein